LDVYSIYDPVTGLFDANTGFTHNPASVYRYTKEKAEKRLAQVQENGRPQAKIVNYSFVFETLGTPGALKRKRKS